LTAARRLRAARWDVRGEKAPLPYLFTDAELAALFFAADNLPDAAGPSAAVAPVLFRLMAWCDSLRL